MATNENGDIRVELTRGSWNWKLWVEVGDDSDTRVQASAEQNHPSGSIQVTAYGRTARAAADNLRFTMNSADFSGPISQAFDQLGEITILAEHRKD